MSAPENFPEPNRISNPCSCPECKNGLILINYVETTEGMSGWDFDLKCSNRDCLEEIGYEPYKETGTTLSSKKDVQLLADLAMMNVQIRTIEGDTKYEKASLRDLSECPKCQRDLVYPAEWEAVSEIDWEVVLRCPNCEWSEVGEFDQPTVDKFDEALDRGTETLVRDLKHLERANMEDEVERFTRALGRNAVLPEDFGRP